MPSGSGIGRSRCGGFHVIAAALYHARRCEEGQAAAARSLEAVGDEVVAGSVGKCVVAVGLIADTGGAEVVTLLCSRDGAAA